jgi:hypothetical protein
MGLVISEGLRLKSYNTPAAIAGVAPTLDYRFALDRREIEAISLTDKLTYTGATNGTFVNRAGLIERATTDQPRFDHGPASRQSLGLLVEPEKQNILTQSNLFVSAKWFNVSTDPSLSRSIASPNGSIDGWLAGQSGGKRFTQVTGPTTNTYVNSLFVKRVLGASNEFSPSVGILYGFSGNDLNAEVQYSWLTNQAVVRTGTPLAFGSINYGNGWIRVWLASLDDGSGTETRTVEPRFFTNAATTGAGASSRGGYIFGMQLEVGAFPTSYIPTTTTALTRPVDSAVIDGTGVITGTYTLVEKPAGCAVVNGTNIDLVSGFTAERVMVFPAALSAPQITAIRGAM